MNPIQLILAALRAGATESASGNADPTITRAYSELKALVLSRFNDNARALRALEDYAEDPETYERPLAKALLDAKAGESEDILSAAGRLLQIEQPQEFDVLRQIAAREEIRTSDRFTRMAQGKAEMKAQEEATSRQRMDQYWDEEFKRREALAERQVKQKRLERRLLIGVVTIAIVIIIAFIAIMVIASRG